jgi:hypothetical protein
MPTVRVERPSSPGSTTAVDVDRWNADGLKPPDGRGSAL